jgi:phosphoribosyl-ATP pyrophosphohydrolase/phosphoribosyl-AMP cyclohydrolase
MSEKRVIEVNIDLEVYFKKSELIPAIIQDAGTEQVLMLAYMNRESLQKTIETGYTWFYSRSRQELWNKGATSGNWQKVISIIGDCDYDTLLLVVEQSGPACHTGQVSCFFNQIAADEQGALGEKSKIDPIKELYEVVLARKSSAPEGSYTGYLFQKGVDKILKKCGEECAEVIIAAKNQDHAELINELSDLWYHLFVLMVEQGVSYEEIAAELAQRGQKIGNLKKFHITNKES